MRVGDLEIDEISGATSVGPNHVRFTLLEAGVIRELASRPAQPYPHEELVKKVWGLESDPGTDLTRTVIKRIRRKLREAGYVGDPIGIVRGEGYFLRRDAGGAPAAAAARNFARAGKTAFIEEIRRLRAELKLTTLRLDELLLTRERRRLVAARPELRAGILALIEAFDLHPFPVSAWEGPELRLMYVNAAPGLSGGARSMVIGQPFREAIPHLPEMADALEALYHDGLGFTHTDRWWHPAETNPANRVLVDGTITAWRLASGEGVVTVLSPS